MQDLHGGLAGDRSEMRVALDLTESGCRIAYPHGHAQQYDLIADADGRLLKVQVKTARHLRTRKYKLRLSEPDKYDEEGVHLFAAVAPEEDAVFYVPYQEMGESLSVTFTPPEEMGSAANRERATLAGEYTFEAAFARLNDD